MVLEAWVVLVEEYKVSRTNKKLKDAINLVIDIDEQTTRYIPNKRDENPEDVDTNAEDHLYDALRYGIMTRPRSSLWDFNPAKQNSGFQMSDPNFGY